MGDMFTVICPSCNYSREIPREKIPPGTRQATCPCCKQIFPFNPEEILSSTDSEDLSSSFPQLPEQPPLVRNAGSVPTTLQFSFNGKAGDYFGIWIVNTLLKIITLGIYSAWAKVRRRRFFYGSTTLDGQPFDYLADPMALFKGWLIAALAFVLYMVGSKVSPLLSMVIGGIIFVAFPWLVVRSRIFNSSNSSHRNIRFSFRPDYRQSYLVFMGLPLLTMLTLGLLSPYMLYRQKKFMIENSYYGAARFTFGATVKEFYIFFLKAGLCSGLIVALVGGVALLMNGGVSMVSPADMNSSLMIIPMVSLFLVYFMLIVYVQTALTNMTWNATSLEGSNFRSTLKVRDMIWLFFSNAVALAASLGLLMPWATVRLMRYRFSRLELLSDGGLDRIILRDGGAGVSATGEEIGDLFDFPVDIAL